jgi:hypothetical protein
MTLDLVKLKNGMVTTLADMDLPPGKYDLIQLYVSSANVELTSGKTFDLMVPSGAQTGVKVFIDPNINVTTKVSTDLLIDFDLSRSFIPIGNPQSVNGITGFNFFPVIRAANLTTSGSISGKVLSDQGTPTDISDDKGLAGAIIEITKDVLISTAVSDEDGSFKVIGLPEGDYSIVIKAEGHTNSETVSSSVVAGNVKSLDDILLVKEISEQENTAEQVP